MRHLARVGGREIRIEVAPRGGGRFTVTLDGNVREVERRGDGPLLLLTMDGVVREAAVTRDGAATSAPEGTGYSVTLKGRSYAVRLLDPLGRRAAADRPANKGPIEVRAIMPGRIGALLVEEGQAVRVGQGVVVVEAMKMENELPAPKDGRVTRIRVRPGETVEAGAALFTVE